MFDENIGKPMVDELARLLVSQQAELPEIAELIHVLDFQKQQFPDNPDEGRWDEKWVPKAADGGWTIIAGDRGKGGVKKGKKLPRLCVEFGITHVLIGAAVHKRRVFKKFATILSVWHELVEIAQQVPTGSRFMLEPSSNVGSHCGRGRLSKREVTLEPPKPKLTTFPSVETNSAKTA